MPSRRPNNEAKQLELLQDGWESQVSGVDASPLLVVARVGILAGHYRLAYERLLAPFNIKHSDLDVLGMLGSMGPAAVATPSSLLRFSLQTGAGMTRALDRLESAGLVSRKAHPEDRRRTEIRLTKAGARQAKQIFRAEMAFMHSLLEDFSDRDRKALTSLVDRLVARLDAFQPGSRKPGSASVT